MARVIKGQKSSQEATTSKSLLLNQSTVGKARIIDKEVFHAQQQAAQIIKDGELEKERILAEGQQKIAQAIDEALARASSEAFAEVAKRIVRIFIDRSREYEKQ